MKRYASLIMMVCGICLSIFAAFPGPVFAAGGPLTVTPKIFDKKAKPRDIIKGSVTLTNNTNHNLRVYAFVHNIDTVEGEQKFLSRAEVELSKSLANWIEITRALIRLGPGETRRIPYLIHVNVFAEPGIYHARIGFGTGSNQNEAEKTIDTDTSVFVNIEVPDDSKERLELGVFKSDKVFFSGGLASFTYLLRNVGNRSLVPRGEIRIYDRRGKEVASIPANKAGTSLLPEATSELAAAWNAGGKFGRYKAFLDLSYGEKQYGTVQDTVYFWIIPWKKILAIFGVLAMVVAIGTYRWHRNHAARLTGTGVVGAFPHMVPRQPAAVVPAQPAARAAVNQSGRAARGAVPLRAAPGGRGASHTISLRKR